MGNNPSSGDMSGDASRELPEGTEPFVEATKKTAKPIEKAVETFYTLKEELGAGAFSTVYAGEKKDTGEIVAIKQVAKKNVPSAEDVQALLEEVGILQEIHHPHVMRIYGFYVDKKNYNLVTEKVVGGELFDRIVERKHYNEKIARDLVKIFLETLDFLHSNYIVHRDLKPENLLLASKDDDTNIKIADFGFAKHTSEKLNTVCGTPDYIAPEVCALLDLKKVPKDKRPCYGTQCDIWSAGVIIYILLGGYPPFFDESRKRLFQKIKAGKFVFHDQYWSETSFEAKDLISKMLTVDPAKRWNAKQLLKHPWILNSDEQLEARDLTSTQGEMKRYVARQRFKGAVDAILAAHRISSQFDPVKPSAKADSGTEKTAESPPPISESGEV